MNTAGGLKVWPPKWEKNHKIKFLYGSMAILNVIMVGFLSLMIFDIADKICEAGAARDFLEQAQYLPAVPWKIPAYGALCILFFFLSNLVKTLWKNKHSIILVFWFGVDLFVAAFVSYLLNFSYKGMLFLVITSLFLYIQNWEHRIGLFILALLFYIFMDHDILSSWVKVVSFQTYFNYYEEQTQLKIYLAKNIGETINFILLVLFFLVWVQEKISENKEYIRVNNFLQEKLNELKIAHGKLAFYSQESIQVAKIKERNRLAREIHDTLGHSLTGITAGIDVCIEVVERQVTGDQQHPLALAEKQLHKIRQVASQGLEDVRRSVAELKEDGIEGNQLLPAIQKLMDDIKFLTPLDTALRVQGELPSLQKDESQLIYRVVQESLTNTLRHGQARCLKVQLCFGSDKISLWVEDDGKGEPDLKMGFGLIHMEERVKLLGGEIEFLTGLGAGFKTKVLIPLRKNLI